MILTVDTIRELGVRKLRSIRKTTGGGEDGEWLAKEAVSQDLSIQDLSSVRDYVQKGVSVQNAVKVVQGELSIADVTKPESGEVEDGTTDQDTSSGSDTTEEESWESVEPADTPDEEGSEEVEEIEEEDWTDSESWLDDLDEEIEEEGGEEEGEERDPLDVTVTLSPEVAEAAEEAKKDLNFDDTSEVVLSALEKYLREGLYLED